MHTTADRLAAFIARHPRLTILSGAGCSTPSGIPDYRDDDGNWKTAKPVQYADFVQHRQTRKRYWARSFVGWNRIKCALPNAAHRALAALENVVDVGQLVTQNVDDLHRLAGSRNIVDLHGVLKRVVCLDCGAMTDRSDIQKQMREKNSLWESSAFKWGPDGDALLTNRNYTLFCEPVCASCRGVVKPDVVFFGEAVPKLRVQRTTESILRSDALLVVGSSLMVWSGYRFARKAVEAGKSLAIVNRGRTRADDIATELFNGDCEAILSAAVRDL